MERQRQGADLMLWLNSPEWTRLPDFLDLPLVSIGGDLQKSDIHALRLLSCGMGEGGLVPPWCSAGLVRLYAHGIIDRQVTETGERYLMTSRSREVLRHNASFRQVASS